jgi:hypothetical protein
MFDRNHNSNGNHGADLISYLYGEMDENTRSAFESHLAQCDGCAVELGAFSDARLGVVEWRRNDFDRLATPEIAISRETTRVALAPLREKKGLFASLAELIGSASVFAKVGVGLAAAALLIGFVYFALVPPSGNRDIAVKKVDKSAETSVQNESVADKRKEVAVLPDKTPKHIVTPAVVHPTPVVKHRSANIQLAVSYPKVRNNVIRRIGSETAKKVAPRLNLYDEEEDRTLRLSDLFSEIGPVKK